MDLPRLHYAAHSSYLDIDDIKAPHLMGLTDGIQGFGALIQTNRCADPLFEL